mmetsp:Transcript_45736/g.52857  ORF Transcript_45736/g.52857 Transcript_45736/m.52857 type:complete len:139 (+) Transcript_45736:1-417(+)
MVVSAIVILFTLYHCYRYAAYHPDLTMYNLAIWTTKPWVEQMRFSRQHPLDKPIFRYIQRCPEYYNLEDPIRELYRSGRVVNDPWLDYVRSHGREADLHTKAWTRSYGEGGIGKLLPLNLKLKPKVEETHGHNLPMLK